MLFKSVDLLILELPMPREQLFQRFNELWSSRLSEHREEMQE
jgi:hypothetical protein